VQKQPDQSGNFDQFRPTFASFPTNFTNQAFGLSWLRTDFSGTVVTKMTTSIDGCVTWQTPGQVSTGSWTFLDVLTGDYGGMAALGDGSNRFYPTWIARPSSQDVVVTAEWSTP
jgi:hypothetical protein